MSDMLEQAIIDADALKEAATKNAETMVLEKYSNEIKKAVDTLLEQEDLEAGMEEELAMPAEPPASAPSAMESDDSSPSELSSVMEHIPLAATLSGDEKIELPLDKLLEEVSRLTETMRFESGDVVMDEDLYDEDLYEDLDEDLLHEELDEEFFNEELDEELIDEMQWDTSGGVSQHEKSKMLSQYGGAAMVEESLVVDVNGPTRSGWAGLPEGELRLAEEELLALEQDSKFREEQEAKRKAVQELSAVNETLTKQNNKLIKTLNESSVYMTKLKDAVLILEKKLEKSSLDNVKLLYQNKALTSDSLNERQKQRLAEAVTSAESIEEAKVIFETLQNTVGSTSRKTQPDSLSEAVQKSSSVILSARKNDSSSQKDSPALDRWKILAGIDNK